MKSMARRRTTQRRNLMRRIAEMSANYVISESTRAAIEKIAEDFAKEALSDPEFRAYMKREATAAARGVVADLRDGDPELHSVKKKRRRRARASARPA